MEIKNLEDLAIENHILKIKNFKLNYKIKKIDFENQLKESGIQKKYLDLARTANISIEKLKETAPSIFNMPKKIQESE